MTIWCFSQMCSFELISHNQAALLFLYMNTHNIWGLFFIEKQSLLCFCRSGSVWLFFSWAPPSAIRDMIRADTKIQYVEHWWCKSDMKSLKLWIHLSCCWLISPMAAAQQSSETWTPFSLLFLVTAVAAEDAQLKDENRYICIFLTCKCQWQWNTNICIA